MTNPTDLAARFEAKRDECENKARLAITVERSCFWGGQEQAFADARDMACEPPQTHIPLDQMSPEGKAALEAIIRDPKLETKDLSGWLAEADQILHDLLETDDPVQKASVERAHFLIHEIAHAVAENSDEHVSALCSDMARAGAAEGTGEPAVEGFVPDHEFKSHPSVFWPAARGEKTFEYRRDDRGGYEVGQTVRLRCYLPLSGAYIDTPPLDRRITNILRGGEFELPKGFCILSLAPAFAEARDMARADAAGGAEQLSVAATDVLAERRRQVEAEGWTPEHDDHYEDGEMATAAGCYAFMGGLYDYARRRIEREGAPYRWPWDPMWWKPTDNRRDLVKAGALILAEIERLDRAETIAAAPPPPAQQGSSSPLREGGWLPMKDAPTGVPIIARHKPNDRMPGGWVATIKLGHKDEEEEGCYDTILHYNGDALIWNFHGCWEGWLPFGSAIPATAPQPAGAERVDLAELVKRARLAALSDNTLYGNDAGSLYDDLADAIVNLVPASLPAALGSGEGTAGAPPAGSGSRPSDQAASHPAPAGFDPSRIPAYATDFDRISCMASRRDVEEIAEVLSTKHRGNEIYALAVIGVYRNGQRVSDEHPVGEDAHGAAEGEACQRGGEAETPTPEAVGKAKALMACLPKWLRPQKFIEVCRLTGDHKQADRFEAALATLTASQEQDGEVRS